jgi:hypothetical protein
MKAEGGKPVFPPLPPSSFCLHPSNVARATFFFARLRLIFRIDEFVLLGLSGTSILKSLILKFVGPPKAFAIAETIGYTLA